VIGVGSIGQRVDGRRIDEDHRRRLRPLA
jgi:hypothetical protein